MGKKGVIAGSIFFLTFLSFIQSVAAQPASGASILQLLGNLIGVEITNPAQTIGLMALVGEMILLVYLPFKLVASRFDVGEELLGEGRNGGRNIALILSSLIVISLFSTGMFGQYIELYSTISLVIVLGVALLALALAISLFTNTGGGLLGALRAEGTAMKADATKMDAQAEAEMAEAEQARERARQVREQIDEQVEQDERGVEEILEDMEDADSEEDEEEAETIEEQILNNVKNLVVNEISGEVENDVQEVEDAVDELEDVLKMKDSVNEGPRVKHTAARINRAHAYLEGLEQLVNSAAGSVSDESDLDPRQVMIQAGTPSGAQNLVLGLAGSGGVRSGVETQVNNFGVSDIKWASRGSSLDQWGGLDLEAREEMLTSASHDYIGDFNSDHGASISSPGVLDYGPWECYSDLERAGGTLEVVLDEIDTETGEMGDAFGELFDAAESLKAIHEGLNEVKELLDELEDVDEKLESIAKEQHWQSLFEDIQSDEEDIKDLSEYESKLEDQMSEAESGLEEAYKVLKELLEIDHEEVQRLRKVSHIDSSTDNLLEEIETMATDIESQFEAWRTGITSPNDEKWNDPLLTVEAVMSDIQSVAADLEDPIDRVEAGDVEQEKDGKMLLEELESMLSV